MPITPIAFPYASQFDEVRTVAKTPVIELSSAFPLSYQRNVWDITGTATINNLLGELELALNDGTDSIILDSADIGRYIPGYSAEIGIGVRIPTTPTDNQRAIWGYSNGNNGIYFGIDSIGIFAGYLSDGIETKTYQSDWNVDPMDGTGRSKKSLDITRGNIFQIVFTWYGYGSIEFQIVFVDDNFNQKTIVVHKTGVIGESSIKEPNLPLRIETNNNGTNSPFHLYVGGRQYSIVGIYKPFFRTTSVRRLNISDITSTSVPFLTFRRKSGYNIVPIRLSAIDTISSDSIIIDVYLNATLTGATYTTPSDVDANETAIEIDTTSTSFSGGTLILSTLVDASGSGGNRTGGGGMDSLSISIPRNQPVTIVVRPISAASVSASLALRIVEEW